jgi:D-xylonolactonase
MEKTTSLDALKNGFDLFANCQCEVGESPLWCKEEKSLYWLDVSRGDVFCKSIDTPPCEFERYQLGIGKIGGMVFRDDGSLLLFAVKGKVWSWRKTEKPELKATLAHASNSRFNDVIMDPEGRVFCGIAPVEKGKYGSLWRMDVDCSFSLVEAETSGMPNGMGFSPDLKHFYFTVTNERIIYRYSYNRTTGDISNKEKFIAVPEEEGFPDGMTVDKNGSIWSAQWNGARLVKYSIMGKKECEYIFPMAKISSVEFGGEGNDKIFITTANYPWEKNEFILNKSGAVFCMPINIPNKKGN